MSIARWNGILAILVLSLPGCGGARAVSAAPDPSGVGASNPVITRVADPRVGYPYMSVGERLVLRRGCLMMYGAVVFWPAGTVWDEDDHKVVFGGDFRGAPSAPVGSVFHGGGGFGDANAYPAILSDQAETNIRRCLARTGATSVLEAEPDWP